jgi:hypothetical protein
MTNLLPTIVPKSDQLNADDLIGRTLTIKITKVALCGEADQPVAIHFEGDNGKPYKPGKSMRRVLVTVWGGDGSVYVGRRMTLYRDNSVRFGGVDVGGIRISHMSDIASDVTMALTTTRANRKPFTVKPLAAEKPGSLANADGAVDLQTTIAAGREAARMGELALRTWWNTLTAAQKAAVKPTVDAELKPLAMGQVAPREPDFDDPPEPSQTFSEEEVEAGVAAGGTVDDDDVFPGDVKARPALPEGLKTGADLLREQRAAEESERSS